MMAYVFPAASLNGVVSIKEWRIGSLPSEYRTPEVILLLGSLPNEDAAAFVWHSKNGLVPLEPDVLRGIVAALTFALCDANSRYLLNSANGAHFLSTPENSTLYAFDLSKPHFSRWSGNFWIRRIDGGYIFGTDPVHSPPGANKKFQKTAASSFLAGKVFETVMSRKYYNRKSSDAMYWLARAQSGQESNAIEAAIVSLVTGFESILSVGKRGKNTKGENTGRDFALRLVKLFSHAVGQETPDILWSSTEKMLPSRRRPCRSKTCSCKGKCVGKLHDGKSPCGTACLCFHSQCCVPTELEDWFLRLYDLRNDIVHNGAVVTERTKKYPTPKENRKSVYAKHGNSKHLLGYYTVGERVLREAIKARIGAIIDDRYLMFKQANKELSNWILSNMGRP